MSVEEAKQKQQKTVAVLILLSLFVIYLETVWNPYFFGSEDAANTSGSVTVAGSSSQPVDVASSATGKQEGEAEKAPNSKYVDTATPAPTEVPQVVGKVPAAPAPNLGLPTPAAARGTYPTDKQVADAGFLNVRNQELDFRISLLGGRAASVQLLKHKASEETADEKDAAEEAGNKDLVDHLEFAPYPLGVYSGGVSDSWVNYQVVSVNGASSGGEKDYRVDAGGQAEVVLQGLLEDGRSVRKTYRFSGKDGPDSNFVQVDIQLSAPAANSSRMELEWTQLIPNDSASLLDPYNVAGFVWFDGKKADRVAYNSLDGDRKQFGNVRWVSMGDKYFFAGVIATGGPAGARAIRTEDLYRARVSGGDVSGQFLLFFGPKSYRMLQEAGFELQRNLDFGFFGFISAPLLSLLHFFYDIVGNYGLAIILLTILVKAALYPLNSTAFKQMKAMQDLQPEMKRIRDTVKDKQQQQIELMSLYKKRGVNPLGGCLPMLVQMPIFFGLYSSLLMAVELRHAPFALWITDLSAPERLMMAGIGIPVMVILFVVSMIVQQMTTPTSADPTQKKVMMVMPVVFGFMFINFPSGLTLYFLTNNFISIAQSKGLQNMKSSKNALMLTAGVSAGIFIFALLLTKLG